MSNLGAWADLTLVTIVCVLTAIFTVFLGRTAYRLKLVQVANHRSSHRGEKPTGGGIGLVSATVLAALWLNLTGPFPLFGVSLVGLVLALIGFQDDRIGLPIRLRVLAQILALVLMLVLAPTLSSALSFLPIWLAWATIIGVGMVWINFFNFMDGIDGMAASEAAFLGTGVLVLVMFGAGQPLNGTWLFTVCLTCAALTFLFFNWAPSRLFMGDGGVYFLSFILLALALYGVSSGYYPLASALILPGLFVTDASVTLARRVFRGDTWHEAHRTHAYQYLSRRLGHGRTTLIYQAINCIWLLVWALIVQAAVINPWTGLIIAYVPLVAFALWANAGRAENAG